MRLIFLGSPPFATPVCESLLKSRHDVAALVIRPDRPRGRGRKLVRSELKEMGDAAGVPVLQPRSTKEEGFLEQLAALEPDVIVVASYGEILRTELLELAPHGAINVHASLLPRWRGASPIQQAILAGDAETGVCVQRMVLALDKGDVLLSRETPIDPAETAGELLARLSLLGGEVAVDALDLLESSQAEFKPQDDALATYAPKMTKADGLMDVDRPATELARFVRGTSPWPGARFVLLDGRELVVLEARAQSDNQSMTAGCLIDANSARLAVGTGALELVLVKPPGKGAMDGAAFLRGLRLEAGERLVAQAVDAGDDQ